PEDRRQPPLVLRAEVVRGVARKVAGLVQGVVGGIKVNEVAGLRPVQHRLKGGQQDLHVLEGSVGGQQRLLVTDLGVLVPTEGDVELPLPVHPPEAVVAGLVQEDHPGGPADRVLGLLRPNGVVVVTLVPVPLQICNQLLNRVLNHAVDVYELRVYVGKDNAFAPQSSGSKKVKENSSAPHKGLMVGIKGRRVEGFELGEQLALAARPLEKWP